MSDRDASDAFLWLDANAMHVLSVLDVLDSENSEYAGLEFGRFDGITRLALKAPPKQDICLIENTIKSIFLISPELVEEIEAAQLSGLRITPVSEYADD